MDNKEQIQEFLQSEVNPVFEQILIDIIKSKPKKILNFCKEWFEKKIELHEETRKMVSLQSESEEEETQSVDEIIKEKKSKVRWLQQRKAICGEVYGTHNKVDECDLQVIIKKTSVNNKILFRLKSIFLFKDFDDQDTSKLISAMKEETYEEDTIIIEQGDEGNEIFIVDEGELHCYRNVDHQEVYIKTLMEGEMFGEISTLYNTKRSANIRSKTKAICFILDWKTFNTVVRQKNLKKRKTVTEVLSKIDLFKELDHEERIQIQDVIKQMPVHLNQYIIKEGKSNSKIFLVDAGKLVALKKEKNGHEKVVANFKDSDYFGIRSTIRKEPSHVSIMALTTSKLYYLENDAIERVIGPLNKLLQRNVEIYEKYLLSKSQTIS